MKRLLPLLLVLAAALAGGCNKPSEANCRKALKNMREILGTDSALANADTEGDIRRCVGGSTKKAVECALNAKTLDALYKCEFIKPPKNPPSGTAPTGSPPTGSAAPAGSAPANPGDVPAPANPNEGPPAGSAAPAGGATPSPGSASAPANPGEGPGAAPPAPAGSAPPGGSPAP